MDQPTPQGTWLGVLCLVVSLVPVLGLVLAVVVQRKYPQDTNANTCAMIAAVLAVISTVLGILGGGFVAWLAYALNHMQH